MIRIRRVRTAWERALVVSLQSVVMANDKVVDPANGGWWWLAWSGKEPVAFAGMLPSSWWADTVHLCRSGVRPEFRGRGIQQRLLRERLRTAGRSGYTWAVSDTRMTNLPSANAMIRTGFQLFEPSQPWGFKNTLYWRKRVDTTKVTRSNITRKVP